MVMVDGQSCRVCKTETPYYNHTVDQLTLDRNKKYAPATDRGEGDGFFT